jgi:hypothetical protein
MVNKKHPGGRSSGVFCFLGGSQVFAHRIAADAQTSFSNYGFHVDF